MGEFLQNNWFWIMLVFFVWMHSSGMGWAAMEGTAGMEEEMKRRNVKKVVSISISFPRVQRWQRR